MVEARFVVGDVLKVLGTLEPSGQRVISNVAGAPPLDWMVEDDREWKDAAGFVEPAGSYAGAHYATFSPKAIARFVKSMCPERVCRICGEPSRRIVDTSYVDKNGNPAPGGVWKSGNIGITP